jgi:hypothetical protein
MKYWKLGEFQNRVKEVITEEMKEPEKWFYLSFADSSFKGGVIIKAHGITDALMKCNLLQINPGGEVFGVEIPNGYLPDSKYFGKFLSKEEILEFWPDAATLGELEEKDEIS